MWLPKIIMQRLAPLTACLILGFVLAWAYQQPESLFWVWDRLGVPAMPPPRLPFTDTISVTHSINCLRAGFDPYLTGRCDPWGRPINYPPVWLELGRLGVSSATTHVLGLGMAAVTLLAMLLIFRTRSLAGFFIVLLTLLSPAILFGIERGNVDTLLFSILVFGLFAIQRLGSRARQVSQAILIVGLTALKAYPIAACSIFLDQTRRGWFTGLSIGFVALLAFAWPSWERISHILSNTPLTSFYSFGAAPLFLDLADTFAAPGVNRNYVRWLGTSVALGVGLLAAAWVINSRRDLSRFLPPLVRGRFQDDLCLAGLAIFCFCFLLGSNFNYRLIFLVGALPKLVAAYDETRHSPYLVAPSAVVALLWATRLPSIVDQALNWLVFVIACAWIAAAVLPRRPTRLSTEAPPAQRMDQDDGRGLRRGALAQLR
jgi:hypothetical protein